MRVRRMIPKARPSEAIDWKAGWQADADKRTEEHARGQRLWEARKAFRQEQGTWDTGNKE